MQAIYDIEAPKKLTTLSINVDLVEKSQALKINLNNTLEEALQAKIVGKTSKKWLEENKKAINNYNEFIEEYGCFSDEYRDF